MTARSRLQTARPGVGRVSGVSGVSRVIVAAVGTALLAMLAGCADQEPEAPAPAPATTTTATSSSPAPRALEPSTSTTTALPGMPTPVSVGSSAVDASRLRSTDDLASVFGCPAGVPPIRITATPEPTAATVPPAPDAIVCASSLADGEALFLWYTPTPEAKLGALTAALDRARYVRGGSDWVAAGQLSEKMGRVGGEVYR